MRILVFTGALLAMTLWAASTSAATPYSVIYGTPDNSYTVRAGGVSIPIADMEWKDHYLSRFAISGPTEIVIATSDSKVTGFRILPRRLNIDAVVENGTIRFTLTEPQNLRIRINGHRPLNLFAYRELSSSDTSGTGVRNAVAEFGIDNSGNTNVTSTLQSAIDEISGAGGGTLFLPAGVYQGGSSSTMYLKSGVRLFLAPGALVRQIRCLINDASDVKVLGHGAFDFTGAPGGNQASYLVGNNSTQIEIRDIISISTDYNWNTRTNHCENVSISNFKVFSAKDGIDPCDSKGVTIDNVFIMSDDDCIAVKSFQPARSIVEDIVVQNCLLLCYRYGGIKIGTETNANIFRNVLFKNIEIISAERASILQLRDGAEITDITIENLTCEYAWKRAVDYVIEERAGLGHIRNITVKNINIWNSEGGRIAGYNADHLVENVQFEDFYIGGRFITTREKTRFDYAFSRDITFSSSDDHVLSGIEDLHSSVATQTGTWTNPTWSNLSDRDIATTISASSEEASIVYEFSEPREPAGALVRSTGGLGGFTLETWDGSAWTKQFERHYCLSNDRWYDKRFAGAQTSKVRVTFHRAYNSQQMTISDFVLLEKVPATSIPVISGKITAPLHNSIFAHNSPITITADASAEGGVEKVEFYANDQKIGEDATAPYEYAWDDAPGGKIEIHARIFDTRQKSDITFPVTVQIAQPHTIPGKLEAEDFALMKGIDVGTSEDDDGSEFVGWTDNGEWMKYLVSIQSDADYPFSYRVASRGGGSFVMRLDGVPIDTFEIPETGGYQEWVTVDGGVLQLPSGLHTLEIYILSDGWNMNYLSFAGETIVEMHHRGRMISRPQFIRRQDHVIIRRTDGKKQYSVWSPSGRVLARGRIDQGVESTAVPIPGGTGCLIIKLGNEEHSIIRRLVAPAD